MNEKKQPVIQSPDTEKSKILHRLTPPQPTPVTKIDYIRAIAYEKLIDPFLEKIRVLISNFVPQHSTVVDIACGTGALVFHLAQEKDGTVFGVDLAVGKIARANDRKANANFSKVTFFAADATALKGISDQQFDITTMSMLLHSLPPHIRSQVLQEAIRVAKKIVIADYVTKQPKSVYGLLVKAIEQFAGGEHLQSFKQFSENGGLETVLKEFELKIVAEQLNPSKTVRVVLVERQE